MEKSGEYIKLEEAYRELKFQLEEANDIINAIRSGEVDALVVNGKDGHQLFTLKSADQSYRIFIEQMTESALTLDKDNNISYCNSQFAGLCKIPLEKVIGSGFLNFVDSEYQNFAKEIIDGAWEVETKAELCIQNALGERIAVQLSLKVLNLDEGLALSIIVTDLSGIKKTEKLLQIKNAELEEARMVADELNQNLEKIVHSRTLELEVKNTELIIALNNLKESEDNLHSAFNAGELGSCSLDLQTGRAEMSEKFRELYGLPVSGEINWDMVLSAVEPEYIPELNIVLEKCITKGKPVDSTYPIRHLITGERRWMRVVGKCKTDENNKAISVYAVLMDVTDQKQDEQRKNDFIAMVSHELKTPLTSMKGYIQVLQLKARQENLAFSNKALEGAERQIGKMTNMINGFLNVSRLESGKISMDFKNIELTELVKEVIEEYATTITSHHFQHQFTDKLFIKADWDKLGQVINNLISNAIKYSPISSQIFINCFRDGDAAVFKITDQGMGISSGNLPRLFERFYRVENASTATVAGFGIGLYLSAEIIKRHGGKIWAESELGKSATFYFSIPLAG
ncbi:ATP-binding protein [Pedobacter sp. UBA5917]|jgi:PAS domain S-box-containing protein|uniref:ATP-binding protein n=1 Tax=Pedobacter sp. UBA5917 TaxID=1947061 RepID=UPI0025F794BC|nr:ATP-binding protein [Pedobacter sp. UBA5917]